VSKGWRPISRRKSWSASVVVSRPSVRRVDGVVGSLGGSAAALRSTSSIELDVGRVELERLDRLRQLRLVEKTGRLGLFEQLLELLSL
jgi:hypothetical protein